MTVSKSHTEAAGPAVSAPTPPDRALSGPEAHDVALALVEDWATREKNARAALEAIHGRPRHSFGDAIEEEAARSVALLELDAAAESQRLAVALRQSGFLVAAFTRAAAPLDVIGGAHALAKAEPL